MKPEEKTVQDIRTALIQAQCSDLLELAGDEKDDFLAELAREIDEFREHYVDRFGGDAPDPLHLSKANPEKGRAFFQAIAENALSVELRIMVWRILCGADIVSVEFKYDRLEHSQLRIVLRSSKERTCDQADEVYESRNLFDFRLLRHLGMHLANSKPLLAGFYAFDYSGAT